MGSYVLYISTNDFTICYDDLVRCDSGICPMCNHVVPLRLCFFIALVWWLSVDNAATELINVLPNLGSRAVGVPMLYMYLFVCIFGCSCVCVCRCTYVATIVRLSV